MDELPINWAASWESANEELNRMREQRDNAIARIVALKSDERRRIAGQILAAAFAVAMGADKCLYMSNKMALAAADEIIRELEAPTKSQS